MLACVVFDITCIVICPWNQHWSLGPRESYGLDCTVTKGSSFRLSVLYLDYSIPRDDEYRNESNIYHKTLKLHLMSSPHHQPYISFLLLLQPVTTHLVAYNSTGLLAYSSGDQSLKMGLEGLKSRCWQGFFSSGRSGGESVPCLLQLLQATYIPWCLVPFQWCLTPASASSFTFPWIPTLLPPFHKDYCDYIGFT